MSLVVSLLDRLGLFSWNQEFIWSSSILPSKTLVLWKFYHGRLPTDQHIQNEGLHICFMCTLCEKHEESIQHLFFECSNVLHIWSWVRHIFLTSHFSNKDNLLSFIKSDGSPLVKLIKFVVITFFYLNDITYEELY